MYMLKNIYIAKCVYVHTCEAVVNPDIGDPTSMYKCPEKLNKNPLRIENDTISTCR